jgi:hypothetical protein
MVFLEKFIMAENDLCLQTAWYQKEGVKQNGVRDGAQSGECDHERDL